MTVAPAGNFGPNQNVQSTTTSGSAELFEQTSNEFTANDRGLHMSNVSRSPTQPSGTVEASDPASALPVYESKVHEISSEHTNASQQIPNSNDIEKGGERKSVSKSTQPDTIQRDRIYVGWDSLSDPENPRNWSRKKKWFITAVGYVFCSIVSLSFSAYSIAIDDIEVRLATSHILSVAGVSLFTLTFGVAPLILAPLSEIWGRRIVYIGSAIVYTAFQLPQALATNITTMLVARFFAGVGGSTAVAVLGGTLADLFSNEERGIPMALFATIAFTSTSVAPALFGYLVQFRGFRPVMWIQFALSAATTIMLYFTADETREGVLLSRKAKRLRHEKADDRYVSRAEDERVSLPVILKIATTRPFYLLFTEPVLQAFTILLSFVYAVLYLLLVAIPIVYSRQYGFNTGQVGLVYLSQAVGIIIGFGYTIYANRLYHRNFARKGPEARLYPGMAGGILMPVGCWIFAWASLPHVHWIAPTIGVAILYTGIFLIYVTSFNSFSIFASSALAAMNTWRNLLGAAFPLFCNDLYDSLGVQGAGSLVAGLSTLLSIIPFLGFYFGSRLRRNSRYAKKMAAAAESQ